MKISSKNFVNINISNIDFTSVSTTREVCVLIDNHVSDTDFTKYPIGTNVYFASANAYVANQIGNTADVLYNKYIRSFFNNGGKKLHYIKIQAPAGTSTEQINNAIDEFVNVLSELPNEEIIIASTCDNDFLLEVAKHIDDNVVFEGINEKVLLTYLNSLDMTAKACKPVAPISQPTSTSEIVSGKFYTRDNPYQLADPQPASQTDIDNGTFYVLNAGTGEYEEATVYDSEATYYVFETSLIGYLSDGTYHYTRANNYVEGTTYYIMDYVGNDTYEQDEVRYKENFDDVDNLIVKYGPAGIEMTVGAYLTQMDINRSSIADYCYTEELVDMFEDEVVYVGVNPVLETSPYIEDNDLFVALKEKFINVDIQLSSIGNIMDYGGNKTNGYDLVNDYLRIILTQTLTGRILNVLKSKIRYNQNGLSLVSASIVNELERYKSFGYISTDKVWTNNDLYDAQGNMLIIAKDTPLTQGYMFKILPFESLSEEDLKNHILPTIYLVYADSYSVRVINLTGYVF